MVCIMQFTSLFYNTSFFYGKNITKLWCWVGGKVQQGHFVTAKRAVVLCSDEGLTLETSGLKLFMAANLRCQLSWLY